MSLPGLEEPAPLQLAAAQPAERNRLTAALRIIWVIPQVFVLFFLFIAAFFVLILGWFGALFTGRLPEFASDYLSGVLRWSTRVSGYAYFLTDEYPPYSMAEEAGYPVKIAIPPGSRLNPLAVLFRVILVIPASIVSSVVGMGVGLFAVASWATITFTGKQPIPLYEAIRVVTRYQMRVYGYFSMLTAEYPWGVMGDSSATRTDAVADDVWSIQLSKDGQTAMIVAIVLGIILSILDSIYRR
jgi:uncharacterized protein DUF4389